MKKYFYYHPCWFWIRWFCNCYLVVVYHIIYAFFLPTLSHGVIDSDISNIDFSMISSNIDSNKWLFFLLLFQGQWISRVNSWTFRKYKPLSIIINILLPFLLEQITEGQKYDPRDLQRFNEIDEYTLMFIQHGQFSPEFDEDRALRIFNASMSWRKEHNVYGRILINERRKYIYSYW